MADDFTFSIENELGTLSTGKAGWTMKLNLVSWGGREAKYDIRSWSPDLQKMGKGVSMTKDEIKALKDILNAINL